MPTCSYCAGLSIGKDKQTANASGCIRRRDSSGPQSAGSEAFDHLGEANEKSYRERRKQRQSRLKGKGEKRVERGH